MVLQCSQRAIPVLFIKCTNSILNFMQRLFDFESAALRDTTVSEFQMAHIEFLSFIILIKEYVRWISFFCTFSPIKDWAPTNRGVTIHPAMLLL